jgi:quinol monooxygenase YgiN
MVNVVYLIKAEGKVPTGLAVRRPPIEGTSTDMSKVHFTARFLAIDKSNLDEFKKLAAECVEAVKQEPGNLEYEWFMSPDESVGVVRETYADSAAVFAHMAGMTELLPRLIELGGGFAAECYGDPSPELIEAAQLAGSVYPYFLGR